MDVTFELVDDGFSFALLPVELNQLLLLLGDGVCTIYPRNHCSRKRFLASALEWRRRSVLVDSVGDSGVVPGVHANSIDSDGRELWRAVARRPAFTMKVSAETKSICYRYGPEVPCYSVGLERKMEL